LHLLYLLDYLRRRVIKLAYVSCCFIEFKDPSTYVLGYVLLTDVFNDDIELFIVIIWPDIVFKLPSTYVLL
jgi:hypothetical protein